MLTIACGIVIIFDFFVRYLGNMNNGDELLNFDLILSIRNFVISGCH